MKKITALILAVLLILPVSALPALADGGPGLGGATISIHQSKNLSMTNQIYSAYKIFDLTTDGSGNYAYTINPAFKSFPVPAGYDDLKSYLEAQSDDADTMNAVAAQLLSYINANHITADASYTINGTVDKNIITVTADGTGFGVTVDQYITLGGPQYNQVISSGPPSRRDWVPIPGTYVGGPLDYGYYLVCSTGMASGGDALGNSVSGSINVTAACSLVTAAPHADIHPKMDGPKLTKSVQRQDGTWGTNTDVNIGDTVNFKLESLVPATIGYSSYVFTIHDVCNEIKSYSTYLNISGLTIDYNSMKVYVGGVEILASSGDYTIATNTSDGCTFEIRFDPVKFLSYTRGDAILVTYSATLNEDAFVTNFYEGQYVNNVNGSGSESGSNLNSAWLEFSESPYTTQKGYTSKSTVYVYTYMVDVRKVDGDTGSPLSGATFALFTNEADANAAIANPADLSKAMTFAVKTVTSTSTVKDGGKIFTYATPRAMDKGGQAVVAVSSDGLLRFNGLDSGTYYLVEISAPTGYNKLTAVTPIVIRGIANDSPNVAPAPTSSEATTVSLPMGSSPAIVMIPLALPSGSAPVIGAIPLAKPAGSAPGLTPVSAPTGSAPDVIVQNFSGTQFPETGGMGVLPFVLGGLLLMALAGSAIALRRVKVREKEQA